MRSICFILRNGCGPTVGRLGDGSSQSVNFASRISLGNGRRGVADFSVLLTLPGIDFP